MILIIIGMSLNWLYYQHGLLSDICDRDESDDITIVMVIVIVISRLFLDSDGK